MATRWAVINGNWSNPATWDGGVLPTSADDVFADGRTVTIDQNVTVLSLRNTNRGGGTLGGAFTMNDPGYTIVASGVGLLPGSGTLLTFTGNGTMNIIGNIVGASGVTQTVLTSGTLPTINITGRIAAGAGANQVAILTQGSNTTLNVTGDVVASGATSAIVIGGGGTQTVNVIGNLYHSATYQNLATSLRVEGNLAVVTITGRIENANSGSQIVYMVGGGSLLTIFGSVRAGAPTGTALSHGVRSDATSNGVVLQGDMTDHHSGAVAIYTRLFRMTPTNSGVTRYADQSTFGSGSLVSRISPDNATGMPARTNVRSGTLYGYNNELSGSLAIPPVQAVQYGVAVDNTTGTGEFDEGRIASVLGEAIASGMSSGSRQ